MARAYLKGPAASWMSSLMALAMVLPIIRLAVSPTPIGLTPGHLSRAMRRQATRAETPLGSTCWEQSFLAVAASASQSFVEKDEHSLFHAAASMHEGPAAPSVLRAILRISCPSIFSNIMGCGSAVCCCCVSGSTRDVGLAGF